MSKAILVIDMPENCRKCDLRVIGAYNFCTGSGGRKIDQMTIINEDIKPDWCPLRPMPEEEKEKPISRYLFGSLGLAFTQGYNACIRQIGENNETDKETNQST